MKFFLIVLALLISLIARAQPVTQSFETDSKPKLPVCKGTEIQQWSDCEGAHTYPNGNIYWGEFKNGLRHGLGKIRILAKGKSDSLNIRSEVPAIYIGQFKNGKISGYGVWSLDSGERFEGEFLDNIYSVPKLEPKERNPAELTPPPPTISTGATIRSSCAKPDYPSASILLKQEGTVTLRFLIGVDGRVLQAEIEKTSGFNRLDEAARKHLSKCQFLPKTVEDKATQSWASMKYTWRLE